MKILEFNIEIGAFGGVKMIAFSFPVRPVLGLWVVTSIEFVWGFFGVMQDWKRKKESLVPHTNLYVSIPPVSCLSSLSVVVAQWSIMKLLFSYSFGCTAYSKARHLLSENVSVRPSVRLSLCVCRTRQSCLNGQDKEIQFTRYDRWMFLVYWGQIFSA